MRFLIDRHAIDRVNDRFADQLPRGVDAHSWLRSLLKDRVRDGDFPGLVFVPLPDGEMVAAFRRTTSVTKRGSRIIPVLKTVYWNAQ